MPTEEKLQSITGEIEQQIKIALFKRNMTQAELSKKIRENEAQVSQAINGYPGKRFIRIRKKIYNFLDIK